MTPIPITSVVRSVRGLVRTESDGWPFRVQLAVALALWALSGLLVATVAVLAHAARTARLGDLADLLPF